jgi:hypothetical protein
MKAIVLLFLACPVLAQCNKGCFDMGNGVCACDQVPEQAPSVKASDEKPRQNGLPAWQAAEIKADMPPSLADQDRKADQERNDADMAGKKAAGIR